MRGLTFEVRWVLHPLAKRFSRKYQPHMCGTERMLGETKPHDDWRSNAREKLGSGKRACKQPSRLVLKESNRRRWTKTLHNMEIWIKFQHNVELQTTEDTVQSLEGVLLRRERYHIHYIRRNLKCTFELGGLLSLTTTKNIGEWYMRVKVWSHELSQAETVSGFTLDNTDDLRRSVLVLDVERNLCLS